MLVDNKILSKNSLPELESEYDSQLQRAQENADSPLKSKNHDLLDQIRRLREEIDELNRRLAEADALREKESDSLQEKWRRKFQELADKHEKVERELNEKIIENEKKALLHAENNSRTKKMNEQLLEYTNSVILHLF